LFSQRLVVNGVTCFSFTTLKLAFAFAFASCLDQPTSLADSHRAPAFEAPELPRVLPTNSRRTWLHVQMFALGVTIFHMADFALPDLAEPQVQPS
jgi:hypothetical protein